MFNESRLNKYSDTKITLVTMLFCSGSIVTLLQNTDTVVICHALQSTAVTWVQTLLDTTGNYPVRTIQHKPGTKCGLPAGMMLPDC
jgi:hypothetical protein